MPLTCCFTVSTRRDMPRTCCMRARDQAQVPRVRACGRAPRRGRALRAEEDARAREHARMRPFARARICEGLSCACKHAARRACTGGAAATGPGPPCSRAQGAQGWRTARCRPWRPQQALAAPRPPPPRRVPRCPTPAGPRWPSVRVGHACVRVREQVKIMCYECVGERASEYDLARSTCDCKHRDRD